MSNSPRSLVFAAALVLLVVPLPGQDSKPVSAAHKKKTPALLKLLTAGEADRTDALIGFFQEQIASGAIYAGQYSVLRKLDWDVQKVLEAWVAKAPKQVVNKDALRGAVINALRDVVAAGKATDELREALKKVAEDWFEIAAVKRAATYALAQFGDRSLVDKAIKEATRKTKSENPRNQVQGWFDLAQIYYNLRQYEEAIKAYRDVVKLAGDGLDEVLYYNFGCSLALAGKKDEAFQLIEKALRMSTGKLSKRLLETDMDIQSLRADERFGQMMKKYFGEKKPKPQPTSRPTSQPDGDKK